MLTQKRIRQSREQRTPEELQLQELANQISELKDRVWFNQWNVDHYELYVAAAKRLNQTQGWRAPVMKPQQLLEKLERVEAELQDAQLRYVKLERRGGLRAV